MPHHPRVVVFDMDGVLCHYRFDLRLEALAGLTGHTPAAVEAAIWQSGFDEDGDRGRYTAEGYLAEFNRRLDCSLSAAQWLAARARSTRPNDAVLALAGRVARRTEIALLTNNGPLFKEGMASIVPQLVELFAPHAYCAYEFGGAKPEAIVFESLAGRFEVACEALFFIDDSIEYVDGARASGVSAYQFIDAAMLEEELRRLDLL